MNSEVKLAIASLLPVLLTGVLYLLEKFTPYGRIKRIIRQIIAGVLFGGLAVIGTHWGIPMNGAQINCRDAAVLSAGLFFGAPAGILAGLIGGVERWFAVYWGVGTFTRLACSVSTIIAGIYAAMLRKYLFEDKKPGILISFAIGVVMEIFHLTMVFITNMATPAEAMAVVRACTVPMVVANGVSVLLSAILIAVLSGEKLREKQSNVRISQTIQRWLLVTVLLAFLATSYFVFSLQNTIALKQTDTLLDLALSEVSEDISDAVADGGDINQKIVGITKNRHIGETGYIFVFDENGKVISAPAGLLDDDFENGMRETEIPEPDTTFKVTSEDETYYCRYEMSDGYYDVAMLPEAEALQMRNIALYVNTFMEILVFAILFGLIYLLIKRVVVNQIKNVNGSLAKITGGNLDEVVNVRTNEEFASLSDDINSTVDTLKRYIAEASARIDSELEFAKSIQASALPNKFPAFPKRHDFDIFASMEPAKEVGGDFYDFYLTENNTLNFLIADVSGKGIPAAMFMMQAKTELKSLKEAGQPLDAVFTHGNEALCEGNDAGMFVTAWQGGIDLTNGEVQFVNAGHNPPLVRHADGQFEYLRGRAGFVLAGMEGVRYKTQNLKLESGDVLFLYTDGVTEAMNVQNELYGEERLLKALNSCCYDSMADICRFIREEVSAFVGEAPQFDDITMMAFRYIGSTGIRIENAAISDIEKVTAYVERELEKADCPLKAVMQINVAIDEIFSNIVQYGYGDNPGPVTVSVTVDEDPKSVAVRFEDEGIPYNPLLKEDPDITLSAEERSIGGLGIFVVKKTMDDVSYRYENEKNILIIRKNIG